MTVGWFYLNLIAGAFWAGSLLAVEGLFLAQKYKKDFFHSSVIASSITVLFWVGLFFVFRTHSEIMVVQTQLTEYIQSLLGDKITSSNIQLILTQIPAFLFLGPWYLIAMVLPRLPKGEHPFTVTHQKLSKFQVPSWGIWVFVISLFLTFVKIGLPKEFYTLGVNLFNISIGIFFLQGFYVVQHWLQKYRIRTYYKILIWILIVFYFFITISLLGLFDYWVDFRKSKQKKKVKI